jgi:hypothetical protein
MRFPETDVMKRTFDLFHDLGIPLIPYRISGPRTWLAYNEKRFRSGEVKSYANDPFKVGLHHGGKVPDEYARRDPSDLLNDKIQPFVDELVRDYKAGLKKLLEVDEHSTRSYLREQGYPAAVIDYIETMCNGTGGFDRALA